jgi:hypothetical protein
MSEAIRLFTVAAGDNTWNSPLMGRAVARWKTNDRDERRVFQRCSRIGASGRAPIINCSWPVRLRAFVRPLMSLDGWRVLEDSPVIGSLRTAATHRHPSNQVAMASQWRPCTGECQQTARCQAQRVSGLAKPPA